MTKEEMETAEIKNFCMLQRIKKDNGDQNNPSLDYEIKQSRAVLSNLGVNVEDLEMRS